MPRRSLIQQPIAAEPPSLPAELSGAAQAYLADPRFPRALVDYCEGVAQTSGQQWPLAKMFDQFARYMVCYTLIHHYYHWRHGQGPAPTLALLQRTVSTSPRQTAGLIASLKAGRLVLAETPAADRRLKHLRPAPEMVWEIGRSVLAFVAASDGLSDQSGISQRLAGETDAVGDLLYRSAAHVLAHGTLIHPFPRVLSFAMRDCGYLLLCKVMRAYYGTAIADLPPGPALSYRALAEALQVSPAHVGNMLSESERSGWFSVGSRGRLERIDPTLVHEFESWCAYQMAHFRRLAHETIAFLEVRIRPAPQAS